MLLEPLWSLEPQQWLLQQWLVQTLVEALLAADTHPVYMPVILLGCRMCRCEPSSEYPLHK